MPLTPKTTEWDDIYGQHQKVTTNPTNQDTQASLDQRHAHMVELMQEAFPPA